MTRREERFEIVVDASPHEVWRSLTTAEGLSSWFGERVSIDLQVHGERVVGWGDEMEIRGEIVEIEPARRLRVAYLADGEEVGAEDWLISSDRATTRITLITSMSDDGVDDWEDFYGDIRRGWRLFLASLRHALDFADQSERRVDCRFVEAPGARVDIRSRLDAGLASAPGLVDGMDERLVDRPHSLLLTAPDRTLLIDIEGADGDQVVYVQAATHGGRDEWRHQALEVVAAAVRDAG